MILYIGILLAGLLAFFIHLYLDKEPRSLLRVVELFLLYQILFSVGLTSLLSFYGLMFMTDFVALYTGWPACPFEKQLANVNLGYAVLSFLCIWIRDHFWLATILGVSIWLIGDGLHHLYEMIFYQNYSLGNVGVPLYTDILVPLELLILYWIYRHLQKKNLPIR